MKVTGILIVLICSLIILNTDKIAGQTNSDEVHYKVGMLGGANTLGTGVTVGLDVGVEYNKNLITLRGNFNSEVGHSHPIFWGTSVHYNSNIWEGGLLYGRTITPTRWYFSSISAGLGIYDYKYKTLKTIHGFIDSYQVATNETMGMGLAIQYENLILINEEVGLGFTAIGNINSYRTYFALVFSIVFGKIRSE